MSPTILGVAIVMLLRASLASDEDSERARLDRAVAQARAGHPAEAALLLESIDPERLSEPDRVRLTAAWYETQVLRTGFEAPTFRTRAVDGRVVDLLRRDGRFRLLLFLRDGEPVSAALRSWLVERPAPRRLETLVVEIGAGTSTEPDPEGATWMRLPPEHEAVQAYLAESGGRWFLLDREGMLLAKGSAPADLTRFVDDLPRR